MDVPEIGFEPPAWQVSQRDERLLMATPVLEHIALYLGIPADVAVLVTEAPEDLGGGVPLLGGAVSSSMRIWSMTASTGPKSGANRSLVEGEGFGLGLLEDLTNGIARMPKFAGDLADGLAIAPRPPNGSVVVHRKHVLDPP